MTQVQRLKSQRTLEVFCVKKTPINSPLFPSLYHLGGNRGSVEGRQNQVGAGEAEGSQSEEGKTYM